MGDYVLKEQDILSNRIFEDAVAYGGWPMDEHTAAGFRAKGEIPSVVRSFKGLYSIPYGCYCSRTIDNLMMAGRDISASKLAMGSTRVPWAPAPSAARPSAWPRQMPRCWASRPRSMAARICTSFNRSSSPATCMSWARKTRIRTTSRSAPPSLPAANSGASRRKTSSPASPAARASRATSGAPAALGEWGGETLTLTLAEPAPVHEVRLVFDPDLSEERCISVSKAFIMKEPRGVAQTLVRDYRVELLRAGEPVASQTVTANHQRRNAVSSTAPLCDSVRVHVLATNGCEEARIYEIRVY